MRQLDRDAARNRHVAFHGEKTGRRLMHRHKRGGAGCLNGNRRALKVQDVRQPSGEEILVIAGMTEQEHTDFRHQIGVGQQVEREISLHAGPGEHTDASVEMLRHMTGIFKRFPGAFQEMPMLRIENGGFPRRKPEKSGVKAFHIGKIVRRPYISRVSQLFRTHPVRKHLLIGEPARPDAPFREQIPELRNGAGRGKPSRHSHNGDPVRCLCCPCIICHILLLPCPGDPPP